VAVRAAYVKRVLEVGITSILMALKASSVLGGRFLSGLLEEINAFQVGG
jgi:hypothetical protein